MDKTSFCGISENCGYQVEIDMEQHDKVIFEDGYNKAIDDFVEKFIYKAVCEGCSGCCNCYEEGRQSECEDWKYYMKMAEQLKNKRN